MTRFARVVSAFRATTRPQWLIGLACVLVVGMYFANHDMNDEPDAPRGDGKYRPVLARGDGHMMYLMARSTALDFDWDFGNDLRRFGDPWHEPTTPTGRKAIVHPIGPALVWTPLIWVAEAGAAVANIFGAGIPMHGYTLWHQRIVFLSSALFGCGAVLLGRWLARKTIGGGWAATYAATAVLLGTSLTYYATYMPSYSHAMDAFACAAFLAYWSATIGRHDVRRWCALGALLGVATLIRIQELGLAIVVVVEVVTRVVTELRAGERPIAVCRRWLGGGAIALAAAVIVFLPQILEWHVVFGKITELPQGHRYTRLEAPMILETLYSPRNGWFTTTPLAYAGVIGLFCLPARSRLVAVGLGLAVALQIYLSSAVLDWWGSAAFGQRRLCNVTLPLVLGLAALIWRCGRLARRFRRIPRRAWHGLLVVVLGGLAAANLGRVIQLRGGRPAPSGFAATCCSGVPAPLRPIEQWVYDRIGNPWEFPASALFALHHDVELSRWDNVAGIYPLEPSLADVRDSRIEKIVGLWLVGSPSSDSFLLGGWSESATAAGRDFRYTTEPRATVFVANLMPYHERLTLWLARGGDSQVEIEWNGNQVARATVTDDWTPVSFELVAPELHTNELTVISHPAPMSSREGWPTANRPVGVAVGELEVQIVTPD